MTTTRERKTCFSFAKGCTLLKKKKKEKKKKRKTGRNYFFLPFATQYTRAYSFIVARKRTNTNTQSAATKNMSGGMPYGLQAMLKVLSLFRSLSLFFERFVSFLLLLLCFVVFFPAVVDDVESQRPPR